MTDHPSDRADADGVGFHEACRWGEDLRQEWPPPWFPLRPKTVRFRLTAPFIDDGQHYCLVVWNRDYWFSVQANRDAMLSLPVFPGVYQGALIRTDENLSRFKIVKRLFEGKAVELGEQTVYEVFSR